MNLVQKSNFVRNTTCFCFLPTFKNIFFKHIVLVHLMQLFRSCAKSSFSTKSKANLFYVRSIIIFFLFCNFLEFSFFFIQSKTFQLSETFFQYMLNRFFNNSFCLELKRSQVMLLNKMLCI